jgi:hypothetical protein
MTCPHCASVLMIFTTSKRNVAIDTENAPPEIRSIAGWMQQNFDELEFVSFIVSFEEMLGIEG